MAREACLPVSFTPSLLLRGFGVSIFFSLATLIISASARDNLGRGKSPALFVLGLFFRGYLARCDTEFGVLFNVGGTEFLRDLRGAGFCRLGLWGAFCTRGIYIVVFSCIIIECKGRKILCGRYKIPNFSQNIDTSKYRKDIKMNIRRGDIYYADLSPVVGSEQGGLRPVLIVQNDVGNKYSPTVIAAAITSRMGKAKLPTHIDVTGDGAGLARDSVILLEQIRTIDKTRLKEKMGHLDDDTMRGVNTAISVSFGLSVT